MLDSKRIEGGVIVIKPQNTNTEFHLGGINEDADGDGSLDTEDANKVAPGEVGARAGRPQAYGTPVADVSNYMTTGQDQ